MSILTTLGAVWPLVVVAAVAVAVGALFGVGALLDRLDGRPDATAPAAPAAEYPTGRAPVPPAASPVSAAPAASTDPVPICRPLPGHRWPANHHGTHRAGSR